MHRLFDAACAALGGLCCPISPFSVLYCSMKLETPSTGERSAKQTRGSAKRWRKPASGSAEPNPFDVTNSVRDGQPSLPPIPDFPEWLPLEGEGTDFPPRARTGLVDVTADPIDFAPVPRLRNRRNGWTAETQALFIGALE